MKRVYIKSLFDLEKDRRVKDTSDWDLIADLILYDLDDSHVYYVFNSTEILESTRRSLTYLISRNNYLELALQDSYKIDDQKFERLLGTPCRDFYKMYKNNLMIELGLIEYII